ncbi:hypothetical protein [Bradyrhizobium sp.]|jgi:hypothetical protein|uniref:hypothetical protein n=1 Tax=Bradyrhizobium sp. TaxID=376 RepID=UPI002DDDB434|nr:hypothetical protein [Bradyrhizobium sp.]HEV2160251.1 hypothetical protein [Bradyrhizobium sp.]
MTEPAAIRFNNPGAMWGTGNSIATKWGSTSTTTLNDGLGQGNNIAFFPTKVQGACAQFDLWRSSKNYRNKTLASAISTWSGGNYVSSYLNFLTDRVPGLTASTVIDEAYLRSPNGIALMKAQAWHESGKPYPMTDGEWAEAQRRVFASKAPTIPTTKAATTAVVVNTATATAAAQAHSSGASPVVVICIIAAGLIAAAIAWYFIHKRAA